MLVFKIFALETLATTRPKHGQRSEKECRMRAPVTAWRVSHAERKESGEVESDEDDTPVVIPSSAVTMYLDTLVGRWPCGRPGCGRRGGGGARSDPGIALPSGISYLLIIK